MTSLIGENVKLELTSTTPQTVTKVTICLVHVFGTVTGVTGNVITLAGFHGTTFTVTVVPGTTTYTSGGAASTFAAIMTGCQDQRRRPSRHHRGQPHRQLGEHLGAARCDSRQWRGDRVHHHLDHPVGRHGTTTTYTLVPGTTTYFEGKTAGVVGDLADR